MNTTIATPLGQWSAHVAGSGSTVVLVHGFPLDSRMWDDVRDSLSARHRVVIPDLPGFGRSTLAAASFTLAQVAAELHEIVTLSAGTRPVKIVGLSMGGYIALEYWRQHPDATAGLVLVDSKAEADGSDARQARQKMAREVSHTGTEAIADAMLPKLLAPQTLAARDDVVKRVRQMVLETPPATIAAAQLAMAGRTDFSSMLSEIRGGVDCICGSEDALTPATLMRQISQRTGGKFREIEGAGHLPPLESPGEFVAALLGIL